MRIISRRTLIEFWSDPAHHDAERPLGYVRFVGTHQAYDRIDAETI